MRFKELIIKNVKYNIMNYISYLTGVSLILSILFMFSNFIYSDTFVEQSKGIFVGPEKKMLMGIMSVMLFTFIIYITVTFTKTRGKELGVYYTIGLTSKEILRILLYENIIISFISLAIGLSIGVIFSKIFNMSFLKFMDIESVNIGLNLTGFGIVLLSELLIFVITCLYQRLFLRMHTIVEIINYASKKEVAKKNTFVKGIIAIVVLILSFTKIFVFLSNVRVSDEILDFKVVIAAVVSLYFSVGFFMILTEKILKFFRKTYNSNIIVIKTLSSRFLSYRTTIFVSILTMSCGIFLITQGITYNRLAGELIDSQNRSDLRITVNKDMLDNIDFKRIIEKHVGKTSNYTKVENIEEHYIQKTKEHNGYYLSSIRFISNSEYNRNTNSNVNLRENEAMAPINKDRLNKGDITLKIDGGEGKFINTEYYIKIFDDLEKYEKKNDRYEFITFNEENITSINMTLTNASYNNVSDIRPGFLVVNDNLYNRIKNNLTPQKICYDILADYENTKDFKEQYISLSEELKSIGGEELSNSLTLKEVSRYKEVSKGKFANFSFAFLGGIFLIGSGVILYFKIFTSLDSDRNKKDTLSKLGLTTKEIKKIINKEISIIFLVPAIISLLITGTLITKINSMTFGGEIGMKIMSYMFTFYIIVYFIIYEISKHAYSKKVLDL